MKRCDSQKYAYKLYEDGTVVELDGLKIQVDLTHRDNDTVIKTFTQNLTVTGSSPLLVDISLDQFAIYLSETEIDASPNGAYNVNVWFYTPDTDFPTSERRRFIQIPDQFEIKDA